MSDTEKLVSKSRSSSSSADSSSNSDSEGIKSMATAQKSKTKSGSESGEISSDDEVVPVPKVASQILKPQSSERKNKESTVSEEKQHKTDDSDIVNQEDISKENNVTSNNIKNNKSEVSANDTKNDKPEAATLSRHKRDSRDRDSVSKISDGRRREEERRSRRGRTRSYSRSRSNSRGKSRKHTNEKKDKKKEDEKEAPLKNPEIIPRRQQRTVDLLTSKTGGAYIPPAKLRLLQAEITDKSSAAYQRIAWEALKKSIHGYINKVNVDNIGIITRELLKENIVRGRGLICRSIIQAQAASPTFTHVYAALVSVINSKFPNIGELLLKRLVIQFKRGFRRNDKAVCLSASRFIAHLVNQRVAHEILALEILTLLVETPTDDSVEVAIAFLKECGMKLQEVSSKGVNAIFEMLKNILHEGKLDKRVQYMIEVIFQVRKDGFKDHVAVLESLELVEEDDQFTHLIMLDEATDAQDVLNVFKFDAEYEDNENKYKGLSKELLGSDGSSSEGGSVSGSGSSDSDSDNEEEEQAKKELIIDQTETNLVALRRTIYLTIHSSLDYEECAHKLMKMELKPGQEMELCHMFLDCCAEQRTYEKFYGLLAQRFCMINKIYIPPFEEIFKDTYATTHRLDTNRLRNVSKFFAHLLFTDAIGWDVLECIRLNEDDTTSSSRIFIKILFQELAEYMGLGKLNDRLKDHTIQESFSGIFPRDNPRNTRFAVNFFTSIGLGGLTDELREHLKNAPKLMTPLVTEPIKDDSSSSDSSSSSSDSSSSDSSSSSSSDSSDSSDTNSSDGRKKKNKYAAKRESKEKIRKKSKNQEKENSRTSKKDLVERRRPDDNRNRKPKKANKEDGNLEERVSRKRQYDDEDRYAQHDRRRDHRNKSIEEKDYSDRSSKKYSKEVKKRQGENKEKVQSQRNRYGEDDSDGYKKRSDSSPDRTKKRKGDRSRDQEEKKRRRYEDYESPKKYSRERYSDDDDYKQSRNYSKHENRNKKDNRQKSKRSISNERG